LSYPLGTVLVDKPGGFVFPTRKVPNIGTPVTIPIKPNGHGGGLANVPPGPGSLSVPTRTPWYAGDIFDDPFDSSHKSSGKNVWAGHQESYPTFTHRDDTHIYGVQNYVSGGKLDNSDPIYSAYFNPNAYWTPAFPGDTPPAGADPFAAEGAVVDALVPPYYNPMGNKPYHYATMKIYDMMGKNRTGADLPDDPYDEANHPITLLYDDQDRVNTNLANAEWDPDGDSTRNQQVSLFSAQKENQRGIRAIARNFNSWKDIGVYSDWDSVNGQNVQFVSKQNVGGHAQNLVERYGRPPNHFTLTLALEPADQHPAFGEILWKPQPLRDFDLGDRINVRVRMGVIDSGLTVMRIMKMSIKQADSDGNVTVDLEVTPHMSEVDEISVSLYPPD
jgi:hypothetical protein